jgi:hypothetical protein
MDDLFYLFGRIPREEWRIIHNNRVDTKKKWLQYTKHSKKKEALIKEIKWLEKHKI